MTRREFLKSWAAVVGVAAVPGLTFRFSIPEPQWMVEEFDWGSVLGVGAKWDNGCRRAASMLISPRTNDKRYRDWAIAQMKQALRQWYVERGNRSSA